MQSEEEIKEHLVDLSKLLKDTQSIIGCLQTMNEVEKLKKQDEEVPPQLEMAEKILKSLSTRISLEQNHNKMVVFIQEQLKQLGEDTETTEELEVENTNLLGY